MKTVAVIGSGPSALLCAHAVVQAGHQVHIISWNMKSEIPGSQHLHGPVPGITPVYPEGSIQFVRMGTPEDYAKKVYGDPSRNTGWDNYFQVYPSWNVVTAYEKLWQRYMVNPESLPILHTTELIDGRDRERVREIDLGHDLVISTIPAQKLCAHPKEHTFESSTYYIKKLPTPDMDKAHEIVVYNGLRSDHWYRWSILGGLCSIETTSWNNTDDTWTEGSKAISNNCDCYPYIQRCGRWAEWRHGATMYMAYQKAARLVEEL